MNCKQVSRLIMHYIDGGLSSRQASGIEAHIQVCEKCSMEIESARKAMQALSAPFMQKEAPDVLQSVKRLAVEPERKRFAFNMRWAVAAAAAVIIAVAITGVVRLPQAVKDHAKSHQNAISVSNDNNPKIVRRSTPLESAAVKQASDNQAIYSIKEDYRDTKSYKQPRSYRRWYANKQENNNKPIKHANNTVNDDSKTIELAEVSYSDESTSYCPDCKTNRHTHQHIAQNTDRPVGYLHEETELPSSDGTAERVTVFILPCMIEYQ